VRDKVESALRSVNPNIPQEITDEFDLREELKASTHDIIGVICDYEESGNGTVFLYKDEIRGIRTFGDLCKYMEARKDEKVY